MFLVRKISGSDHGKLYAMKVLKKASVVLKQKTLEHTKTERQVLENIRYSSFLVTVHYAFQTATKLHLILGNALLCSNDASEANQMFSFVMLQITSVVVSSLRYLLLLYYYYTIIYYLLGELFTHLYQRDSFTEDAVRIYAGELILALESLHKVLTILTTLFSSLNVLIVYPFSAELSIVISN